MTSLLSSASVWTNSDTDTTPKKRISTLKRPQNRPYNEETKTADIVSPTQYNSQSLNVGEYSNTLNSPNVSQNFEDTMRTSDVRTANINNIINKITTVSIENDGQKLANFVPISGPTMTMNKPDQISRDITNELISPEDVLKNSIQQNASAITNTKMGNYTSNNTDVSMYSNYNTSYEPSKISVSQYGGHNRSMGNGSSGSIGGVNGGGGNEMVDNKLLEKINYMIHLLEEQRNEKTANVTEEFILYSFLGIFMIFIVDSFARSGKYVR
jgi:hypothetical protein